MKLINSKDIRKITEDNIVSNVIDKIMARIISAAENGQYGVKIKTIDKIPTEIIIDTFQGLGYNVSISTTLYTGVLKKYTEININWK